MRSTSGSPLVIVEEDDEEEPHGRSDGYPAKRQRRVESLRDAPAHSAQAKGAQNNAHVSARQQSETPRYSALTPEGNDRDIGSHSDASDLDSNVSLVSGTASTNVQPLPLELESTTTNSVSSTVEAERPASADLVCFGRIPHVACKRLPSSTSLTADDALASETIRSCVRLNLVLKRGRFIVGTQTCEEVAYLNSKVTNALLEITMTPGVECEVYVEPHQLTSWLGSAASSESPNLLYVDANILGPIGVSQQIGESLSVNELYLQDPRFTDGTREYFNPQVLDLEVPESEIFLHELFMDMAAKRNKSEQGSAWNTALDDMSQHELNANAVDVDATIVTTSLLPHQREALDFMCQRELGGRDLEISMRFWTHDRTENGNTVYRHKITADERAQSQIEPQGGIIADEMGLGKTLTAISLVVSSLQRANGFASHPSVHTALRPSQSPSRSRSRATLVVVPSTQLMDSWFKQLEQHTRSGELTASRYHGHERAGHFTELINHDIVITTYGTIAKEFSKQRRKVLYHMCFFRIILDEAHVIRTSRTKLFSAIMELEAIHHWCLTGTPVSNKIEDLFSLLSFCRLSLLGDKDIFRTHVTVPSRKSFQRGCNILRETLRPICLRRNKGIIGLAHPKAIETEVEFSPAEAKHYRRIFETGRRAIDASVSGRTARPTRNIMLKILLELRIFCSQGTFRQNDFLADAQPLDSDELFTLLEESEDAHCASCHSEVTGINQVDDDGGSGVLGTCSHILCMTCYNSQPSDGPPKECPACEQVFEAHSDDQRSNTTDTTSAVLKHSCKLNALVQDLLSSQNAQAPEKSIVFSYWRKTIDIAADLCSQNGIPAVVVHGKTPQADRTNILERFAEDFTISALLMTIGTGGLGLTINAASRVHILEPQWNPSVEEQAIGRVVRLGQNKPITVIRYIVKDSVERQIQGYQKRKKALAASGFGHRSENTMAEETVRLNAAYIV